MPGAETSVSDARAFAWSFVEEHSGLVAHLARAFRRFRVPLDDLESEGRLGLFEAALRFDPSHGVKFPTYATWWVLKRIREAVASEATIVRVPRSRLDMRRRARAAERELRGTLGRAPSVDEIAAAARIASAEIDALRNEPSRDVSLDDAVAGRDGRRLEQTLPQHLVPQPDAAMLAEDGRQRIGASLSSLTERHRSVLVLRYGLDGRAPKALAEIARMYDLSRERVRQIETEAVGQLRRLMQIR